MVLEQIRQGQYSVKRDRENVIRPRQPQHWLGTCGIRLNPTRNHAFSCENATEIRSSHRPGESPAPPTIPGEHTPAWDPFPSACEGGVHSLPRQRNGPFLCRGRNFCTYPADFNVVDVRPSFSPSFGRFRAFGQFHPTSGRFAPFHRFTRFRRSTLVFTQFDARFRPV